MRDRVRKCLKLSLLLVLIVVPTVLTEASTQNQVDGSIKIQVEQLEDRTKVFAVDVATGARRLVYSGKVGTIPSRLVTLSPNEQYVALVERDFQTSCSTHRNSTKRSPVGFSEPSPCLSLWDSQSEIILIDLERHTSRTLVRSIQENNPTNPVWSPDSSMLAYVWNKPKAGTVELWVADIATEQKKKIVSEQDFWAVLFNGWTDTIAWERDCNGIQFFDERDGEIIRATLEGEVTEVKNPETISPSLVKFFGNDYSLAASTTYEGMVKPLDVRDYDGECGDGYSGLYPYYGGCVEGISGPHPGVDMSAGSTYIWCGTPVVAVCDGLIVDKHTWANSPGNGLCEENSDSGVPNIFGSYVVLRCDIPDIGNSYSGRIFVTYAHLKSFEPGLKRDIWVSKGDKLGEVGSTGNSTGSHLHFQMERDNQPQHPNWWNDERSIRAYTWNPMYFIQAHENIPTAPASTDCLKPLLRYWHDEMTGHFYTSRWEDLGPGKSGWAYEGFEGYVAAERDCFVPDTRPLYRFWHPDRRKHFYTTSEGEKEAVESQGFVSEGVAGYVLPEEGELTQPLYRCYSSQKDDHFYTTNWNEVRNAVDDHGYTYEHVEGYVFAAEALESNPEISVYLPLVIR